MNHGVVDPLCNELPDVVTSGMERLSKSSTPRKKETSKSIEFQPAHVVDAVLENSDSRTSIVSSQKKAKTFGSESAAMKSLNAVLPNDSRCKPRLSNSREKASRKSGGSQTNGGSRACRFRYFAKKLGWQRCSIISLVQTNNSEREMTSRGRNGQHMKTICTQTDENIEEFIRITEKKYCKPLKRKISVFNRTVSSSKAKTSFSFSHSKPVFDSFLANHTTSPAQVVPPSAYNHSVTELDHSTSPNVQQVPVCSSLSFSDNKGTNSTINEDDSINDWLYELFGECGSFQNQIFSTDQSNSSKSCPEFMDLFEEQDQQTTYHPLFDHYYGKEHPVVVYPAHPDSLPIPLVDEQVSSNPQNENLPSSAPNLTDNLCENFFDSSLVNEEFFLPTCASEVDKIFDEASSRRLSFGIDQELFFNPFPFSCANTSETIKDEIPAPNVLDPKQSLDFSPRLFLNLSKLSKKTLV